jgi:hypothetical protein
VSVLDWFRGGRPTEYAAEAKLPGQREPEGELVKESPTWIYVRNWAVSQLEEARASNDSLGKGEVQTAALRGEIKCLRKLLTLPDVSTKPTRYGRRGILEDGPDEGY